MDRNLSKLQEIVKGREAWCTATHGVAKSWTRLSNWTAAKKLLFWATKFAVTYYSSHRKLIQKTISRTDGPTGPTPWASDLVPSLQVLLTLTMIPLDLPGCWGLLQGPHRNPVPSISIPQTLSVCQLHAECHETALQMETRIWRGHCAQDGEREEEIDTRGTGSGLGQAVASAVPEVWARCYEYRGKNEINISRENLNYSSHWRKSQRQDWTQAQMRTTWHPYLYLVLSDITNQSPIPFFFFFFPGRAQILSWDFSQFIVIAVEWVGYLWWNLFATSVVQVFIALT